MPFAVRRQQRAITIRSDHASARLALLTRDGRSQVAVIEEALDRMPLPSVRLDLARFRREVATFLAGVDASQVQSMTEFDASHYNENGLPKS